MAHCELHLCCEPRVYFEHRYRSRMNTGMQSCRLQLVRMSFPSNVSLKADGTWDLRLSSRGCRLIPPTNSRRNTFICRSFLQPANGNGVPVLKGASVVMKWSFDALSGSNLFLKLMPAVGVVAFAAWGLGPLIRLSRDIFLNRSYSSWEKSSTHYITISYVQPLLMWTGVALICRALDPVVLPTEAGQAVKLRVLNFTRSLSTVLAFAQCLSSLIQQAQKRFAGSSKNMGFSFAGKAVYSAVWVSAVSLFMELLGFSTHKLLTAGGFGTVLLTLSSRELFTNFLSGVMIHATRPFIVNERIQTKISGYEVSGTVEQVGWWSPTVVRGDDREAVHVPNHKFAVSVVRNISQKSHWRIKTHLAISHMDADKINSIVADMRKVLAKNPQIEQQKLHRRVFLENIDPENQALMIMVSCFVKTSHSEQYLRVKEDVLLDLLRVISHHRARLATPIRSVQYIDIDEDFENLPFAEGVQSRSHIGAAGRSVLLKESSYKIYNDEKGKASSRSTRTKEGSKEEGIKVKSASATDLKSDAKKDDKVNAQTKTPLKDKTKDASKESAAVASSESGSGKADKDSKRAISPKTKSVPPPLEDNIVLGVALDGSKRMLPIEEETVPSAVAESKELTAQCNGSRPASGTSRIDKKDSSQVSGTSS